MQTEVISELRKMSARVMREAALTGMTRAEVSRHLAAELLYAPDAKLKDFQFIDAGGRHWKTEKYFKMLGRTLLHNNARECYLAGCAKAGSDIVTISVSGDSCDACGKYENALLSISGATPGLPTLEEAMAEGLFHPNCTHRIIAVPESIARKYYGMGGGKNAGQSQQIGQTGTFTPAKTIKEATAYTKQHLGDKVNWNGMPLDTVNTINQELTQLKAEYPILGDKYKVIGRNGKWKSGEAAHAGAEIIEFNPQYATLEDWKKALNDYEEERRKCIEQIIELNKKDKLTKEETKLRDKLAEHLKYSRYNVLISPEQAMQATVTHESGHTIMYRKIYGEQDAAGYTVKRHWRTGAELKNPNLKEEDTDTYKLVQDTFNQAVKDGDIYKISEYAKTDCWEFFSESFAMYRLEKQNLPDYIVTMIEKVVL